jgi:peptidoglycan/xylan/chitin deacetylase (PgdA/CDA1 family)
MRMRGIGRLRRIARRVSNIFVPHAVVLLYHRVTELPLDPQLLCVSPRNFAEHLEIIRNYGRTIQIKALGEALQSRGHSLVVTFDDGYADNLYNAKPLLDRYDVPATVFVTSGYVGAQREFWYDDLERILLHTGPLPETLRLKVDGHGREWQLGSTVDCGEGIYRNREWNTGRKDNPTARHGLYRSLFEMLHPMRDVERRGVLNDLAAWAGMDTIQRPSHRTLTPEELGRLADGGLVEVGSHTVSHPVLSALPLVDQQDEISQSKDHLEEILGHSIVSFAYPFGGRSHYTPQTVTAVRDAGFKWACSNFAGVVRSGTDSWQLPRFVVRDWDGDQFLRQLKRWVNG